MIHLFLLAYVLDVWLISLEVIVTQTPIGLLRLHGSRQPVSAALGQKA